MKNWIALALLLAGCAVDPVLYLGSGQYSVTASGASMAKARLAAVEDAQKYCAPAGKTAEIATPDNEVLPSASGAPTSTIVFSCH